jgi:hypothetical protein
MTKNEWKKIQKLQYVNTIGKHLYGPRWIPLLAKELKLSSQTVYNYSNSDKKHTTIPPQVIVKCSKLLQAHIDSGLQLREEHQDLVKEQADLMEASH